MYRKPGRPRKRPNFEEFYNLYDDKSKSMEELSTIWGVKKQTIYQWASYYNQWLNKSFTIK